MSTIDDALLSAYLDGELSGSELTVVETALATEPSVGKRLATLKLVNELMRGHARSIDAIPLPAPIRELVATATVGNSTGEAPAPLATVLPFHRRPALWLPLAASVVLAIGLGFGTLLQERAAESTGSALQSAHASLLQTLPSGSTHQGEGFRLTPQFSFINNESQACRIYRVDAATARHTRIACLDDQGWQLVDEFAAPQGGSAGAFVPATGSDQALETRLDELMAAGPLSREQEQVLLDNDWQAL